MAHIAETKIPWFLEKVCRSLVHTGKLWKVTWIIAFHLISVTFEKNYNAIVQKTKRFRESSPIPKGVNSLLLGLTNFPSLSRKRSALNWWGSLYTAGSWVVDHKFAMTVTPVNRPKLVLDIRKCKRCTLRYYWDTKQLLRQCGLSKLASAACQS